MLHTYEFWFVVGSQFLYGPEVLETVAARAAEMADKLNASGNLPCKIVYKVTAKTNAEISDVVREANYQPSCAGIITWCHTFSPSKMWINGFANLQKPYCHFATQYNREIPNEEIDMDFMNLNQAAHGDREHGFIAARLRMPRKVIAGYWQDEDVQKRLGDWMRAAVGVAVSRELKVMRFGDNMREVAVTEGDKVEVQAKLGWQVNTWPVGQLVDTMNAVTDAEIDALMDEYRAAYDFASEDTDFIETVRYQAREEIAMKKMLDAEGCKAFSNTFQDLYGMRQLPGIASQHLMAQGYGYGGEGDWKVAAMTAIIKAMAEGKTGGTNIFSDVKSTDWFYRAVVNSTQYGWIHGYGDGTFRPNNPITRVEVTAIVNNMLGREADVDFVTEHYDELNHFSDLEVSHWGYYHIVEATNDHDYTKPSSGENWTELN